MHHLGLSVSRSGNTFQISKRHRIQFSFLAFDFLSAFHFLQAVCAKPDHIRQHHVQGSLLSAR